ncbi:MAG: hypothetical protein ACRECH_07585 [Nitrososphaerales archaeon]
MPEVSDADRVEERMRAIHSTLANKDALAIFNMAAEGINGSLDVLAANNFSKKRYYVRLRELTELGMIYKDKGIYRHTAFGTLVYENQVKNLKQILFKRSSIEILQDLKQKKETDGAHQKAIDDISHEVLKDLESALGLSNLKPVRLFRTWNELSGEAGLAIISAMSDAYVATRYVDFRTAETALDAAKRGRKISIIHSPRSGFSPKLQLIGNLMTHPRAVSVFRELTHHENVTMKEADVPYSFMVIDSCKVGIEVVNPLDPYSFFLGLLFESPALASKLVSHFKEISSTAERDSISEKFEADQTMSNDSSDQKSSQELRT